MWLNRDFCSIPIPTLLQDVDLILSCGDLPPEYLSRLVNCFKAPLYYVRGNHDIRYDEKPPEGCRDLHGKLVKNKRAKHSRFGGVSLVQWRTLSI